MDDLPTKALATVDDAQRDALLRQALEVAMEDYGVIPLHFEVTPWAFRKDLTYAPRLDQYTLAFEVKRRSRTTRHALRTCSRHGRPVPASHAAAEARKTWMPGTPGHDGAVSHRNPIGGPTMLAFLFRRLGQSGCSSSP